MTLLDHLGRPIDLAAIREPQTAHTGSLRREFDQHPARGLTPARLQAILVRAEMGNLIDQLELADDIEERDGHCYAELSKRAGAISALEWDIHAPEQATPAEEAMTAELREWLQGMPAFGDVLLAMMDAVLKGFAMHEMVWSAQSLTGSRSGQRLCPAFTFTPQRLFTTSGNRRELMLRSQRGATLANAENQPAMAAEPLQPLAWLAHVHRSRSGYLTRNGLVRVLAWPYLFKNYSIRDLAEFLEIFGLPLRLGKYPAGASEPEKRALLQAVVNIGHNAAGIIPQGMSLDFEEAAKGTEGPFTAMWDRMEAIQSKVILGQTLTAQQGERGSQALGNVHNEVRMDIRNADARQVEGTINAQLVRAWCLVNHAGADPQRLPRFAFDTGEGEDLQTYAENLPKLVAAGMSVGVEWAHKKLRIPVAEAGEATLRAPSAAPPGAPDASSAPGDGQAKPNAAPAPAPAPAPASSTALAARATQPQRDAIDDLVDEQAARWHPQLAPLVQPLLAELSKAVAAGESLQAFAARLPELVQGMDARPLAEQLARASFSARLAGEAGVDLDEGGAS